MSICNFLPQDKTLWKTNIECIADFTNFCHITPNMSSLVDIIINQINYDFQTQISKL